MILAPKAFGAVLHGMDWVSDTPDRRLAACDTAGWATCATKKDASQAGKISGANDRLAPKAFRAVLHGMDLHG